MSTRRVKRSAAKTPMKYDEYGWPLCRWCSSIVPTRYHTFCCNGCVHQWKLRTSPSYLRESIFKRDKGICNDCGCDTKKIEKKAKTLKGSEREEYLVSMGIPPHRVSCWDAHHVVPVENGGGECDESNIITLCFKCHKIRTRKMRFDK